MGLFNRIVPDFCQIGDKIIKWIRNKKNVQTGIVDIAFTDLGGHMYRVVCNITYNEGGQPKRATGIVNTTITNEDTPTHISNCIENKSLGMLKLTEDDLETLDKEIVYNLKLKVKWIDVLNTCHKENISFINLTDRVFYTLIEFCNSNGNVINCSRAGIIENLPDEISNQLYPFKSYRFAL